jgi:tRNA(adenine34) deaminase
MDAPLLGDDFYMLKALQLAEQAYEEDEVPIGALVVSDSDIIGKGYNQTERLNDSTAHAEMLAITAASNALNSKVLEGCTLYVTIQPCVMCAGAILNAKISKVVYGAYEPKTGCSNFIGSKYLTKSTEWVGGILEDECTSIMQDFFKSKR